jgi:hypothetical protein
LRGGRKCEEEKREGEESQLHGWISLAGWLVRVSHGS